MPEHVDPQEVGQFLGVRSVQADLTIKERALALTTPASAKPGRYKPPDAVLAFLESL